MGDGNGGGGGSAPSVVVGGARKAPPEAAAPPQPARSAMIEQVGKMVDDSKAARGVGSSEGKHADPPPRHGDQAARVESAQEPESADAPREEARPNPKKRMWEEDKEARKYEQMTKDEL